MHESMSEVPRAATRSSTAMLARSQASASRILRARSILTISTERADTPRLICLKSTSKSSSPMVSQLRASLERLRISRLVRRYRAQTSIQTQFIKGLTQIESARYQLLVPPPRSLQASHSARTEKTKSSMTSHKATRALRTNKYITTVWPIARRSVVKQTNGKICMPSGSTTCDSASLQTTSDQIHNRWMCLSRTLK